MKKIFIHVALCAIGFTACKKDSEKNVPISANPQSQPVQSSVARTVSGITFGGVPCWFQFGEGQNINSQWTCTENVGICKYNLIDPNESLPSTPNTARGEIVYDNNQFIIALDKSTFSSAPNPAPSTAYYLTKDGEFHWVTLGVVRDADSNNPSLWGDLNIPAGTYPIYEDANWAIIVIRNN